MSTAPPEDLDQHMNARRIELRMTWREVAEAADMSESGLRAIRKGRNPASDLAKGRIEWALWWEAGSIDAILEGGEPTPAKAQRVPTPPELAGDDNLYTDPVERRVWSLTDLPEEERRDIIMRIRRAKRRQSNA